MGSGESSTRKVSFGLDEEDRVRILRGVKLSEDVLQRMRGTNQSPDIRPQPPIIDKERTAPQPRHQPSAQPSQFPRQQPQPQPQPSAQPGPTAAEATDELKKSSFQISGDEGEDARRETCWYEREQTIVREELTRIARREREAGRKDLSTAVQRERAHTRQEADKAKQLGMQLEKKEAELKALEAFYREQLAQLEKKNFDLYKSSTEQFHEAATKSEAQVKLRSTEGVCPNLQAQVLTCYRDNRTETLRCSDLAKEYMQCIETAKKNLLVSHG